MGIHIDAMKCVGCMACEMACGYHRDDGFAFLSACIVLYRAREKKDFFGVLLKEEDELVIASPEGEERRRIGAGEESEDSGGDSSAKPMLLREACDLCEEMKYGPMCVQFCPTEAITQV